MKKLKSQWDFGELFPQETYRRVLSVSELTASVRRMLETQIGRVWVTGEISNLRLQSSGHVYFSIKDGSAQLACVLFRGEARTVNREGLQDGQKVILQGDLTVYEARGQYQLRVTAIELCGVGALQARFEQLKQKLLAEGLFANDRKRPIPKYPQHIGIVTSPTGAAIRDVIHVVRRRYPGLKMTLASCRVQGQGAAEEIACAIRLLNDWARGTFSTRPELPLGAILVTRGGGSLEDLWAFNEEVVARAVFDSHLPVVSAVGHEIDFTICDFTSDFRAATPSAAAEILTEGMFSSRRFVAEAIEEMRHIAGRTVSLEKEGLRQVQQRLVRAHPRRRLEAQAQRLDDLQSTLARCSKYHFQRWQHGWARVQQRLAQVRPSQILERRHERMARAQAELLERSRERVRDLKQRLTQSIDRLRLLSPVNVLERGYSITSDAAGRILRSAEDVGEGEEIRTQLSRGKIRSRVQKP